MALPSSGKNSKSTYEEILNMTKKSGKNLIVGLDIGTTKVVTLIGEITEEGSLEIVGVGSQPSRGLKKGVVVNIEATVQSIQRAIEEAELMAGCQIHSAYTGIAGNHIRSLNSHGIVAIRDQEVTHYDIERVIDAARAVAIPADQKILHILPQEFIIDSQEGIREPVGMSGVRLEARVHMVTGAVSAAQNIVKCVRRCGLEVADMILEQLASSYAVLNEDEKELGVCLIDIGGGTTDIAVFTEGAIRHTAVIPIAGDQVTNDVAFALRTPTQNAEEIKLRYGSVQHEHIHEEEMIAISSMNDRPDRQVARKTLNEAIEARYEELFALVKQELRRSGFEDLIPAGLVVTGGGSKMEGVIDLAEKIFQAPIRQGIPQHIQGLSDIVNNPAYATAAGLLMYGQKQQLQKNYRFSGYEQDNLWFRMKNWFKSHF
jgi:cell division protein FtsA